MERKTGRKEGVVMNSLSYKQEMQLINIANSVQMRSTPVGDDVAFVALMRICRDYVNNGNYPLMQGEKRDKWLIERLKNYRIRFFDRI
jgi:hypothetical protein